MGTRPRRLAWGGRDRGGPRLPSRDSGLRYLRHIDVGVIPIPPGIDVTSVTVREGAALAPRDAAPTSRLLTTAACPGDSLPAGCDALPALARRRRPAGRPSRRRRAARSRRARRRRAGRPRARPAAATRAMAGWRAPRVGAGARRPGRSHAVGRVHGGVPATVVPRARRAGGPGRGLRRRRARAGRPCTTARRRTADRAGPARPARAAGAARRLRARTSRQSGAQGGDPECQPHHIRDRTIRSHGVPLP